MADVTVVLGAWEDMRAHAEPLRTEVFVDEQKVPAEIEIDAWDPRCVHALALDPDGAVLGTGRLLPDGHIGRMAVHKSARGQGVGTALLRALMQEAARRGHREAVLSAQTHAVPFYERECFRCEGAIYDDAGIPHVDIRRALPR